MPKTRYTTVNGMLIGERTDSGNRIDYVPDALGSIVAAVDQNLNTTYTAAYKPYGDVLSSTGTAPRFTWVGSLGYLVSAGVAYAEYSVRARIASSKTGRWTRVDPLWPNEFAYGLLMCDPISVTDPSGLCASLTLDFTTVSRSKLCPCENGSQNQSIASEAVISWLIAWNLSTAAKGCPNTGWIVQQIVLDVQIIGVCVGEISKTNLTYYEAWQVINGKIYQGWAGNSPNTAQDYWQLGSSGGAKCPQFTGSLTGSATFYLGVSIGWMNGDDRFNYGALPTTTAIPPFWGGAQADSNTKERRMSLTMACCGQIAPDCPVPQQTNTCSQS